MKRQTAFKYIYKPKGKLPTLFPKKQNKTRERKPKNETKIRCSEEEEQEEEEVQGQRYQAKVLLENLYIKT